MRGDALGEDGAVTKTRQTTCPHCGALRDCEGWRVPYGSERALSRCHACGRYFVHYRDGRSELEKKP